LEFLQFFTGVEKLDRTANIYKFFSVKKFLCVSFKKINRKKKAALLCWFFRKIICKN